MVSEQQVLLVDAGNSRIKSVLLNNANVAEPDVHLSLDSFLGWLKNKNFSHLYLSNVGKNDISERIASFCVEQNVAFIEIFTEKENFGIKNRYENVSRMGVDRWLAMVAAQEMTEKPFCVIDVGTAITCDFVVDGQHLGGWITPGYHLMQDALVKNTARVFAEEVKPSQLAPGTYTEECVSQGCLAAVNGVYLSAVAQLASERSDFAIIIGGGDKNMLAIIESTDTIRSANLVVQGLARYARSQLVA